MKGEFSVVGQLREGSIEVGEWCSEPCDFEIHFTWDETAYFLEGSVTLRNLASQKKFEVSAGSFFVFEKGSRWHWTVLERTKKVFTAIE